MQKSARMRPFFQSLTSFTASSAVIVLLVGFRIPIGILHTIIVILVMVFLLLINLVYFRNWKSYLWERRVLLFLTTLSLQLLVLSTGGFSSPFFVMLHLFIFGLSIIASFQVAVMFLVTTIIMLLFATFADISVLQSVREDPVTVILYLISVLAVVPFAQAIASHYRFKDDLANLLRNQVKMDEAILSDVEELVIVTDPGTNILSVNDSVEKTLHKSRSELLDQLIFQMLYVRDQGGLLLKKHLVPIDRILQEKMTYVINNARLLTTSGTVTVSKLQIHTINDVEGKSAQLAFIFTLTTPATSPKNHAVDLEEVRVKRDALFEELRKRLHGSPQKDLEVRLLSLSKLQQDIERVEAIENRQIHIETVKIDLASLCDQTVQSVQGFASAFKTLVRFSLTNFDEKDIAPLVSNQMHIAPKDLTGPFFTVACDVKQVSLILQKLIDLSILLASTEQSPKVDVAITRSDKELIVSVSTVSHLLEESDVSLLWQQFYGPLIAKTNLQLGSGLEGYVAKATADLLSLPLEASYDTNASRLTLSFRLLR